MPTVGCSSVSDSYTSRQQPSTSVLCAGLLLVRLKAPSPQRVDIPFCVEQAL